MTTAFPTPCLSMDFHFIQCALQQRKCRPPTAASTHLKFASPAHFTGAWEIHITMRVAAPRPHHHNKQSEISETRPALSSSTDRITIPVSNKLKLKLKTQAQSSMYLFSFSLICGNCRIDRTGGAPQNNKEFFIFFLNMGGSFSLADYL